MREDLLLEPETASLEERILVAAFQRFHEHGIDNVTMQEIAEAAKTSVSGIYRAIGTKDDLIVEVFDYCWRRLNDYLDRTAPIAVSPDEAILARIRLIWRLRHSNALRETTKMAFIMYRRSEHLGVEILPEELRPWSAEEAPSGSSMPRSREFEYFVRRLRELCEAFLRSSRNPQNIEFLTYSLLNYAGITYLSWCLWGEQAFTEDEALKGVQELMDSSGGLKSRPADPVKVD